MEPEKVIRAGMVAVLVSPGYGAGWSTWAGGGLEKVLMFDRAFVEAAEAGVTDVEPVVKRRLGSDCVYCGGWRDVEIEWLPVGTAFTIEEYDGSESLRLIADLSHTA